MFQQLSESFSENRSQSSQKKVLYFSDGTLEVDNEREETEVDNTENAVDPVSFSQGLPVILFEHELIDTIIL